MFKVFSSVVRLSGLFFVRISQEQTGGVASFGESGPSRALGISGSFGGFFFITEVSFQKVYRLRCEVDEGRGGMEKHPTGLAFENDRR